VPRIRSFQSQDPQYHRRELENTLASLQKRSRHNLEAFIADLFTLFTDRPGVSWRFASTTEPHIVFHVVKRRTGKCNFFLRVFTWGMVMNREFMRGEYQELFPRKNGYFGRGDDVSIEWGQFGPEQRQRYMQAIRSMTTSTDLCSLDVSGRPRF